MNYVIYFIYLDLQMKSLPEVTQLGRMTENGHLYPAWLQQSLLLSFPQIFIDEMEIGLEFE